MTRFNVQIGRTTTRRLWVEIEAADEAQAKRKALAKAGELNFFDGTESTPEYAVEEVQEIDPDAACDHGLPIKAEVHSDDHNFEVPFDAAPWFQQATVKDILELTECGWGGDYPADVVAHFMAERITSIAEMFRYLERMHKTPRGCGFECHVDEPAAIAWLKINRPDMATAIAMAGKDHAGAAADGVHPPVSQKRNGRRKTAAHHQFSKSQPTTP